MEAGISETVHSAAWFKHEPKCLALGVNNKQLKVIDFRGEKIRPQKTRSLLMYNSIIEIPFKFF